MQNLPKCVQCSAEMHDVRSHRRFCSTQCKGRWQRSNKPDEKITHHHCRNCGEKFQINSHQHNKWLCSEECRRASNAKSVREFHHRRPLAEKIYRSRTKEKKIPDSQNVRFNRINPGAPKCCESCGESRVLEIAHKPGHERLGKGRTNATMKWPEMVWVLCPTCHRLIDRMGYDPAEMGLSV